MKKLLVVSLFLSYACVNFSQLSEDSSVERFKIAPVAEKLYAELECDSDKNIALPNGFTDRAVKELQFRSFKDKNLFNDTNQKTWCGFLDLIAMAEKLGFSIKHATFEFHAEKLVFNYNFDFFNLSSGYNLSFRLENPDYEKNTEEYLKQMLPYRELVQLINVFETGNTYGNKDPKEEVDLFFQGAKYFEKINEEDQLVKIVAQLRAEVEIRPEIYELVKLSGYASAVVFFDDAKINIFNRVVSGDNISTRNILFGDSGKIKEKIESMNAAYLMLTQLKDKYKLPNVEWDFLEHAPIYIDAEKDIPELTRSAANVAQALSELNLSAAKKKIIVAVGFDGMYKFGVEYQTDAIVIILIENVSLEQAKAEISKIDLK